MRGREQQAVLAPLGVFPKVLLDRFPDVGRECHHANAVSYTHLVIAIASGAIAYEDAATLLATWH